MDILLADDDAVTLGLLADLVSGAGHAPYTARSAEEALELLRERLYPLILTDIRMGAMSGIDLLRQIKSDPRTQRCDVIICTGHAELETAVAALRLGAYDYLSKPVNAHAFLALVERCAEHQHLLRENQSYRDRFETRVRSATDSIRKDLAEARRLLRESSGLGQVILQSEAMRRVASEARLYHQNPSTPVLLEGETGTGKDVIARLIHYGETGTDLPFIALNCTAIPPSLFESELFGYEEGAFTGGRAGGQEGKLALARDGTFFLDEIGDMPLELQPKLLRVLQERTYYRVGGTEKIAFEARIICATNQSLTTLVDEGRFRKDLYYRLQVGHLRLPPLRERPEDIPPLARLFLQREAERKKRRFREISGEALRQLQAHAWTGNVRELENTIQRAVLTADGEMLLPEHLHFLPGGAPPVIAGTLEAEALSLPDEGLNLEDWTDRIIRRALEKFGGNQTRTAQYLGISRFALRRRLGAMEADPESA